MAGWSTTLTVTTAMVCLMFPPTPVLGQCLVADPMENKYSAQNNVAVARADSLEFLSADGGEARKPVTERFQQPTALAFDAAAGRMFLSDSGHANASIFQLDTASEAVKPLVAKQSGTVHGLAYHPGIDTLFWTTGVGGVIGSLRLDGDSPAVVIKFERGQRPIGIAVDVCPGGMMYWTDNNPHAPSIGRSDLAGKKPEVLVSNDLHEPLGIAVDHDTNHLYWTDDREGIYFKIESCHLDGSHRRTVLLSTYHRPYALAVSADALFYTDWSYHSVWSVPKAGGGGDVQPTQIREYRDELNPMGLVTHAIIECRKPDEHDVSAESTPAQDDATTVVSRSPDAGYCLNAGALVDGRCACNAGFSGPRCEREACFNYCVTGRCALDAAGNPTCTCSAKYAGVRCEVLKCRDFCVNGGCVLDRGGRPRCQCDFGFRGPRCELNETATLAQYDLADNATAAGVVGLCSAQDSTQIHRVVFAALAGVAAVLAAAVGVLARKVVLLRRRPRIKKQFIVKKNVTPLTSRPPAAGETCEITIENCCNMNICETPCFEPQLRSSKSSSRKEEKADLLGSMEEEEPSCSPGVHGQLY